MFLATQLVMAQYKLSGRITDFDTQEPVKNASVYLVDLKKSTVSDQNGNYAFQNLKSGKYFVEITSDNYTSLLVSIEVNQDAVSDFTLQKWFANLNYFFFLKSNQLTFFKIIC